VIRNGILNGYPFVEAFASWLDAADRIVVVDGGSIDGTDAVLDRLKLVDDRVSVVRRQWPEGRTGGSAIAELTMTALSIARASAGAESRLMYVQADEVYTAAQRRLVRDNRSSCLEFAGCVNFWNSTETVVQEAFPMTYVRLLTAGAAVRSLGDGYSFEVSDSPVERTAELILHYGWCFPINILQKHVSHAAIYRDNPAYALRGRLASMLIERKAYDRRYLEALAPQYTPVPYGGTHPPAMSHLRGAVRYDPYVGLDLLRSGVRW